jgi:hypothetical protein
MILSSRTYSRTEASRSTLIFPALIKGNRVVHFGVHSGHVPQLHLRMVQTSLMKCIQVVRILLVLLSHRVCTDNYSRTRHPRPTRPLPPSQHPIPQILHPFHQQLLSAFRLLLGPSNLSPSNRRPPPNRQLPLHPASLPSTRRPLRHLDLELP